SLDAESGLLALWSHRLGARVLPVHRGSGSVKLLPPLARFIIGLFTDGPVDAVAPWQALWRRQDEGVDHGALSPRLRIGNVVFDRRKMVLAASELPHRGKAEPVGGYLVRVEHWRRERGVPQTCFVRFVDLAGPAAATRRHARWP